MAATSTHAFAEKVALVAGADDPVGRAVALQLALSGAFVIVGCRHSSAGGPLDELRNLGTLAAVAEGDVRDLESAKRIIDVPATMFGRLDLLVNCERTSGSGDHGPDSAFDSRFADAVREAFLLIEAAAPLMSERPKPRIVNVFREPSQNVTDPLAAAKSGAMKSLTEAFARSLPPKFRLNAVRIEKNGIEPSIDENTLLRRQSGPSPDDVARVVMFLLSGEAIAVNGQAIRAE